MSQEEANLELENNNDENQEQQEEQQNQEQEQEQEQQNEELKQQKQDIEQINENNNNEIENQNEDNQNQNDNQQDVSQLNDIQVRESQIYDPDVFMTQQKQEDYIWKCYDFLFPAGKLAKLIKINDYTQKIFPYLDILTKLKLDDGYPVVNFIGANQNFQKKDDEVRGKFYAGIARACFNTDAIIVDNSITNGVERFGLKRGVKIFGIAPESQICFPKLNPTKQQNNELSNGHTHICLISDPKGSDNKTKLNWDDISSFKLNFCKKLAEGKLSKTQGRPRCKIVNLLFLDNEDCFTEIREVILNKLPIIVIKGSKLCNRYLAKKPEEQKQEQEEQTENNPQTVQNNAINYSEAEFDDIMNDKDAHIYKLDSLNSEEIAQFVHFFLTYTPY